MKKSDKLFYTFSIYFNSLLGVGREIFLISLLTPTQLGLWRIIITLQGYCKFLGLNAPSLIIYRGQIKGLVNAYSKSVVNFLILTSLLFVPIFSLLSIHLLPDSSQNLLVFIMVFLLACVVVISNYLTSFALSCKNLRCLSFYQILSPVILVLLLWFIPSINLSSLFLVVIFSSLIPLIFFKDEIKKAVSSCSFKTLIFLLCNFRRVKVLFSTSLNNLAAPLAFSIFHTSEIWVAGSNYGLQTVGYLSVIFVFVNVANMSASIFSTFMLAFRKEEVKLGGRFLLFNSVKVFVITIFVVITGLFFFWFITNFYFDKYLDILSYLFIYALCIPFLAIRNVTLTSIIANNDGIKFSIVLMPLILVKIISIYFFAESEYMFFVLSVIFNIIFGIVSILLPYNFSRNNL